MTYSWFLPQASANWKQSSELSKEEDYAELNESIMLY